MILVTGGTGTIGSEVVKQLAQKHVSFRVLARDPAKVKGAEAVKGDLADPASLDAAFKGVKTLFLLCPSNPDSTKWRSNAIAAAKKAGVQRVVNLSVIAADATSPVMLARWHAQTEKELAASGLQWTNLRPGGFMQNTLSSAPTIKSQGAIYGVTGDGAAANIDARDIAAAAVVALTGENHAGKTYTLTGPELLTASQIASALSSAVGKPVKYVDLPPEQFKSALLSAGLPDWLATDYLAMGAGQRSGGWAQVDPTLEKLIGRKPTRFEQFARDYAAAFKA